MVASQECAYCLDPAAQCRVWPGGTAGFQHSRERAGGQQIAYVPPSGDGDGDRGHQQRARATALPQQQHRERREGGEEVRLGEESEAEHGADRNQAGARQVLHAEPEEER